MTVCPLELAELFSTGNTSPEYVKKMKLSPVQTVGKTAFTTPMTTWNPAVV